VITITLTPELEQAAMAEAKRRGIALQELTAEALSALLAASPRQPPEVPIDEWERRLEAIAIDCGVSLPDEALSSEALYD
jgi:hypothetical protein